LATASHTYVMSVYRVVAHFYGCASSCIQGIAWNLTSIHPSIMQRLKTHPSDFR
jgi:hypothetical protein